LVVNDWCAFTGLDSTATELSVVEINRFAIRNNDNDNDLTDKYYNINTHLSRSSVITVLERIQLPNQINYINTYVQDQQLIFKHKMEVEYYKQKFNADNDLSNSVVLSKYRSAADIVNAVLPQIISRILPGASITELCKYGDQLVFSHTSKVYNKNKVEKGVALPTMICVNNYLQYFSPLPENDVILQHGDLVKIELGVHIDGYIASAAHTTILNPNPQQPIE
ncbi:4674_t:CDS:2, partial [Racocetra persica]